MNESTASGRFALYSDFNCPFCYAMHERLHTYGVMERVEWRGVQHAPHLPIPMARWNGHLLDELHHEVAMVNRLAPMLPIAVPEGKPNTRPAIQLAARVLARDVVQGSKLVRRLYWLFWREGRDISEVGVLHEAVASLGRDPQGINEKDEATAHTLEAWDHRWRSTGQAGVPLLERPDGTLLVGLARESDLDRFLASP
ncbi:MAG: DsbA family oxidoreductase [Nitrospiraceae bacterium]